MGTDWESGSVGPDGFSPPTYHQGQPPESRSADPAAPSPHRPPGSPREPLGTRQPRAASVRPSGTGDVTVTRAVMARGRYLSKLLAHKVIAASQADGARESGLTALIWNQVMSYAADAMVTVALAGTVFFSAPSEAQRGNVLLYLLMTMAPFALVAPIIGPALDRVQHGRRWVMAGTAIGRAVLAVVMAQNFTDLYVLFPAALGSLVLSKAYAVIRSTAAPRLVPSNLTLVEANARLSIFGLAAAVLGGGVVGAAIKLTGSYPFGLWITAAAFAATAFYSFRLPKIVDALPPDAVRPDDPADPLRSGQARSSASRRGRSRRGGSKRDQSDVGRFNPAQRLLGWASRGFSQTVVLAMQGECTLRWLSGFITLFLAFYIESTSHGWQAVASLGAMGGAMGVGNFLGTGIGTRLKLARPDLIILTCNAVAGVACLVTALFFSLPLAIVAALFSAISNALAKLSLDALIQRDVAESLRSSAFGRSETFLQLSWVLGATIAILLPAKNGQLGFIVAAVFTVTVAVCTALRERTVRAAHHKRAARLERDAHPGNLGT
ncbi:MAG: transporter [Frankiales bacterium]|nr:transporter [Frankiales bacterium]